MSARDRKKKSPLPWGTYSSEAKGVKWWFEKTHVNYVPGLFILFFLTFPILTFGSTASKLLPMETGLSRNIDKFTCVFETICALVVPVRFVQDPDETLWHWNWSWFSGSVPTHSCDDYRETSVAGVVCDVKEDDSFPGSVFTQARWLGWGHVLLFYVTTLLRTAGAEQ